MPTKFYLNNYPAFYTPTTPLGAWNSTTNSVVLAMGTNKHGGELDSIQIVEASPTAPFNVLMVRGVSTKLQPQTISGTFDVILGVNENIVDADLFWYIHSYVIIGDSDTVRGTLINNYNETANEWFSATKGTGLVAPITLNPVSVLSGDRIVIEIGYVARNVILTPSKDGTLWYGTQATELLLDAPDLTIGAVNTNKAAGTINFSQDILFELVDSQIGHQQVQTREVPAPAPARLIHQITQVAARPFTTARLSHIIIQSGQTRIPTPPIPPGTISSGIYFIDPNSKHDSLNDDVTNKIPNPTIRIPYIGE